MESNSYLVRGDRCSNSSEDNSKDFRLGKNTPSCIERRNLAGRFQGVQKSTQWWSVSRGPSISLLFTLRALNQQVERDTNVPTSDVSVIVMLMSNSSPTRSIGYWTLNISIRSGGDISDDPIANVESLDEDLMSRQTNLPYICRTNISEYTRCSNASKLPSHIYCWPRIHVHYHMIREIVLDGLVTAMLQLHFRVLEWIAVWWRTWIVEIPFAEYHLMSSPNCIHYLMTL